MNLTQIVRQYMLPVVILLAMALPVSSLAQDETAAFTPATPIEDLALVLADGNGYTLTSATSGFQFQDGVLLAEGLNPIVVANLAPFDVIDIYFFDAMLQQLAEYYPTGVFGRIASFENGAAAANYVDNLLAAVVLPEQQAGSFAGNLVSMNDLPAHDEAIAGWTFDTYADDGGALPSVRYVAQVGTLAVSITVVSQNPDIAASAALSLINAQIGAARADQPVAPIAFPPGD